MSSTASTAIKPAGSSADRNSTRKALRNHRLAETFAAWSLAGPALVLLISLFFLPVFAVFAIALTDWQFGASTLSFVGLANFEEAPMRVSAPRWAIRSSMSSSSCPARSSSGW